MVSTSRATFSSMTSQFHLRYEHSHSTTKETEHRSAHHNTPLAMRRSIIATLSMIFSAQLIANNPPAKSACDDSIAATATIVPKLDSPLFHETKTSLNWWIVESESGAVEDTTDGEIGPADLVRNEHTASCTSTHQGEHLMEFCAAVSDGDAVRFGLSRGMPAYASSLSVSIEKSLAFHCDFSATYPALTPPLRWKITKKELRLRSCDLTPGHRVLGWISVTFEETEAVKGALPKTYKIEGYIKPVIQHKPA